MAPHMATDMGGWFGGGGNALTVEWRGSKKDPASQAPPKFPPPRGRSESDPQSDSQMSSSSSVYYASHSRR